MKNIINTIRTYFGLVATTDSAIAGIAKAVAQLNEVAAREDAAVDAHLAAMEVARVGVREATERAMRAERISERLNDLIGG